jgi:hypothetical protein
MSESTDAAKQTSPCTTQSSPFAAASPGHTISTRIAPSRPPSWRCPQHPLSMLEFNNCTRRSPEGDYATARIHHAFRGRSGRVTARLGYGASFNEVYRQAGIDSGRIVHRKLIHGPDCVSYNSDPVLFVWEFSLNLFLVVMGFLGIGHNLLRRYMHFSDYLGVTCTSQACSNSAI